MAQEDEFSAWRIDRMRGATRLRRVMRRFHSYDFEDRSAAVIERDDPRSYTKVHEEKLVRLSVVRGSFTDASFFTSQIGCPDRSQFCISLN